MRKKRRLFVLTLVLACFFGRPQAAVDIVAFLVALRFQSPGLGHHRNRLSLSHDPLYRFHTPRLSRPHKRVDRSCWMPTAWSLL
jgi:hypothetical protein